MRIGHQCKQSVLLEILVFVLYENKFEVTTKNCDKTIVVYFQSIKLVIIAHNIIIIPNKSDVFKMMCSPSCAFLQIVYSFRYFWNFIRHGFR